MSEHTGTVKEYEQVMSFHLPSDEDLDDATYTLGLDKSGKACLMELLCEIDADLKEQCLYLSNRLTRDEAIKRLGIIEKTAKDFRKALAENNNILPSIIPHKALEDLGELFAFSAINEIIGRDIRPVEPREKSIQKQRSGKIESTEPDERETEAVDRKLKRDAGLAHADKLVIRVLDTILQPIDAWHEERKRQSKGGRTKNKSRRDFVLVLALNAEKIIGEKPGSDVKGKFFDLCELVFEICGVPTENLKNLIGEVVREGGLLTNTVCL
jgi:hypothetical protein